MSLNPMTRRRERCSETRERLSDHLDGQLDPDQREAAERHLRWCSNCARMLQNLSRTVGGLHRLRRPDSSEGTADPDRS
jgi:anti-sigma factor RsiW